MQNVNQKKNSWLIHIVVLQCLSLVSCFPYNSAQIHRAACNDLKSKIVFNGATSDTRRAEIEKAQTPLTEYTYDVNCEKNRY